MEDEEYKRREEPKNGKKGGLIPSVIRKDSGSRSEGVVMTTDSESETEIAKRRAGREAGNLKWTEELEDKLEEMLMENYFDFHKTSKDFSTFLNDGSEKWYSVDAKTL